MKVTISSLSAVTIVCAFVTGSKAYCGEAVRFESTHIRFVEVTFLPGEKVVLPAQSTPAVVAVDGSLPNIAEAASSDGKSTRIYYGNRATPPTNAPYPWCRVDSAEPQRSFRVTGKYPLHYYRIEYKRIDGDAYADKWRVWYPWILDPVKQVKDPGRGPQSGPGYSAEYPYPKAYDPTLAAPANHFVRYEDAHVQLVEVVVRPGETENFHGHPYSSVFADDGGGFYPGIELHNEVVNPDSINPRGKIGLPPSKFKYPTCFAAVPEWPHAVTVTGGVPQHFYRLHFKTLTGEHR
jgi:hypothetical protein